MLPFWKDSPCLLIPSWNLPFSDDYGLNVRYYILLNLGEWKVQKNTFARLSENLKSKILATMVPPPRYNGSITNLLFWVIPRLEGMKTGLSKIAKASRGISSGPQGLTAPHMNPQLQGSTVLMHCLMAYDHKTQPFMKNGGQQMYLEKALEKMKFLRHLEKSVRLKDRYLRHKMCKMQLEVWGFFV